MLRGAWRPSPHTAYQVYCSPYNVSVLEGVISFARIIGWRRLQWRNQGRIQSMTFCTAEKNQRPLRIYRPLKFWSRYSPKNRYSNDQRKEIGRYIPGICGSIYVRVYHLKKQRSGMFISGQRWCSCCTSSDGEHNNSDNTSRSRY